MMAPFHSLLSLIAIREGVEKKVAEERIAVTNP